MQLKQLSLLFFLSNGPSFANGQQCTVCPDRSPVSVPDRDLGDVIPGGLDCGTLDTLVNALPEDSALCASARATSTLCGCAIPKGGCFVCPDGERVPHPDKELTVPASDLIFGAPAGQNFTCESLEAALFQRPSNSEICWRHQKDSASECGCQGPVATLPTSVLDNGTAVVPDEASSFRSCTVCIDGGTMLDPLRELNLESQGIPVKNCGDLQSFAALLEDDGPMCAGLHMISTYCGCDYMSNDACTFCADGSPVTTPDHLLGAGGAASTWRMKNIPDFFEPFVSIFSCGLMEAIIENYDPSIFGISVETMCIVSQIKSGICGCDHDWKPKVVTWCFRMSGFFSLLGSMLILYSIYMSKDKAKNTYHQAMIGISVFDSISSLMYILGTVPTPKESGLYQAVGNEITCKIQGFFLQLGTTSALFNAALSIYFYLVVAKNWRERKFLKLRRYVFASITVLGFAMSFAAIPFYQAELAMCYVATPPAETSFIPVTIFYTVPVGLSLLVLTTGCLALARFVRQQQRKSAKWDPNSKFSTATQSTGSTSRFRFSLASLRSREKKKKKKKDVFGKVFFRSLCYMASFLVTMPVLIVRNYLHASNSTFETSWAIMTWFIIVAIVGPLQGFLNALVFFSRNGSTKKLCKCCTNDIFSKCKRQSSTKDTCTPKQQASLKLGREKPSDGAIESELEEKKQSSLSRRMSSLTLDSGAKGLESYVADPVNKETPNVAPLKSQCEEYDRTSKAAEIEESKMNEDDIQAAEEEQHARASTVVEFTDGLRILQKKEEDPGDDNQAAAEEFLVLTEDDGKFLRRAA